MVPQRDKSKPRAHKVKDVSDQYNRPAWEYSDGSIRGERGHMIQPLPGTVSITTTERAYELNERRVENKHRIIQEAANQAVENGQFKVQYGGDAWIAELAQAAQRKATNIDDPKQIDAARFLLQEAGLAERMADARSFALPQQPQIPVSQLLDVVRAFEQEFQHRVARAQAVDAEADDA